jgi:hypothetical protein
MTAKAEPLTVPADATPEQALDQCLDRLRDLLRDPSWWGRRSGEDALGLVRKIESVARLAAAVGMGGIAEHSSPETADAPGPDATDHPNTATPTTHIIAWIDGGTTAPNNLAMLCVSPPPHPQPQSRMDNPHQPLRLPSVPPTHVDRPNPNAPPQHGGNVIVSDEGSGQWRPRDGSSSLAIRVRSSKPGT